MESFTGKQKKIAIFDFYLGGHHIEYLHHIYMNVMHNSNLRVTFIIPNNFESFKAELEWPVSDNIDFVFYELDDKKVRSLSTLEKSRLLSRLLNDYVKKTGIKDVVLIELMPFLPLLPFIVDKDIRLTGIVYNFPIYSKEVSLKENLYNKLIWKMISYFKVFQRVCLLNSKKAVEIYNKRYKTNKFSYLPDPYIPIPLESSEVSNIRKLIKSEAKVFVHLGGMSRRKGTLLILDALLKLDASVLRNKTFIFAGRIIEDIHDEFYHKVEELRDKVQIIVIDRFCKYSTFGACCDIADFILIPYMNIGQSSGVCSYAAQFRLPVIGPDKGLLGEIIRENGLGYTLDITVERLAEVIEMVDKVSIPVDVEKSQNYLSNNTPLLFYKNLLNIDIR